MALGRSLAPSPSVQEQRSVDFERVVANSLTVLQVELDDEYHRVSFCDASWRLSRDCSAKAGSK